MSMDIKEVVKLAKLPPEQLAKVLLIVIIIFLSGKLFISENINNKLRAENNRLNTQQLTYIETRRIEDRRISDSINNIRFKERTGCDSIITSILKEKLAEVNKINKLADKEILRRKKYIKNYSK